MTRTVIFAVACLLSLPAWACVQPALQSRAFEVIGTASDREGRPIYRERLVHRPGDDGGRLEVVYADPAGQRIAEKRVTYRCRPATPSFVLADAAGNTLESVSWQDQAVTITNGDGNVELDPPSTPSIVDAGFDNAIRLHWDALLAGDRPEFNYLFPREGRFFRLRFARVDEPPARYPGDTGNLVHFRITPANSLLRLFSSPLYVGYDRDSRNLRYYLGPSNLPSMRRQKDVLIVYEAAATASL